jgi:hypothetical protein
MAKRQAAYHPRAGTPEQAILQALKPLTYSGYRTSQIFDDWVFWSDSKLRGEASDIAEHTKRCQARYGDQSLDALSQALDVLTDGIRMHPERDILGRLYMNWANPNAARGQFFTPESIGSLLAQMTLMDTAALIGQRLQAACDTRPAAQYALRSAGLDLSALTTWDDLAVGQFCRVVLPWIVSAIEPITSLEPCCGSGVLILAQIATLPLWFSQVGLIQYTAIDIDPLCVAMCRLQTWSLGIPVRVICANALSWEPDEPIAQTVPSLLARAYAGAAAAQARGDAQAARAFVDAVNAGRAGDPDAPVQLQALLDAEPAPDAPEADLDRAA